MANVRVMAIFSAFNALPEDRYVNTFHFSNADSYGVHAAICAAAVEEFYTSPVPTTSVGSWLSPVLDRDFEIRTYNLSDLEPRVPTTTFGVLPAAQEVSGLPEEVAVVNSFHGDPPITGRRRGRIYLGPLSVGAVQFSSATSFGGVAAGFRSDLLLASAQLAEFEAVQSADWCIRSGVPVENFVPVTGGWVDGAPDTQRRRGAPTTIRSTWTL